MAGLQVLSLRMSSKVFILPPQPDATAEFQAHVPNSAMAMELYVFMGKLKNVRFDK